MGTDGDSAGGDDWAAIQALPLTPDSPCWPLPSAMVRPPATSPPARPAMAATASPEDGLLSCGSGRAPTSPSVPRERWATGEMWATGEVGQSRGGPRETCAKGDVRQGRRAPRETCAMGEVRLGAKGGVLARPEPQLRRPSWRVVVATRWPCAGPAGRRAFLRLQGAESTHDADCGSAPPSPPHAIRTSLAPRLREARARARVAAPPAPSAVLGTWEALPPCACGAPHFPQTTAVAQRCARLARSLAALDGTARLCGGGDAAPGGPLARAPAWAPRGRRTRPRVGWAESPCPASRARATIVPWRRRRPALPPPTMACPWRPNRRRGRR